MSIAPWSETAAELIAVAARRAPADLVIRDCSWVNVHSREVLPGADIAIRCGRFASCGPDATPMIGPGTRGIEAGGRHLIPGPCDGHLHVGSGMLTVTQFARAVMPRGTTTMFVDPHEVANALGPRGGLGSIAPGRRADRILTSNLAALPIETVAARGEIVAEAGLIDVTRFEKTDLFLPA